MPPSMALVETGDHFYLSLGPLNRVACLFFLVGGQTLSDLPSKICHPSLLRAAIQVMFSLSGLAARRLFSIAGLSSAPLVSRSNI